ncbi:MAG: tRNA (N(6)-L-threonylcarbamoyladenosine(37)-C(2))-methylthiotransferase MtaB [Granulosicoccus sp.]
MRIHLSALGCRLNEAELEHWASEFTRHGHKLAKLPETADVLVMNSCAVTREAVRKSRQKIMRLKRSNPMAKIVVTGCYSELASEDALAELGIDLVVSNKQKDNLVPLAQEVFGMAGMPQSATLPAESALFERNRQRAFIKIQDGCRYRCTFCIVTVARGDERSRSIAHIVSEVQKLAEQNVREVVLTGVHVGGYGADLNTNLESLVCALLADTTIDRIRFASVEPWDLSDNFLKLFENKRLQPHMHLPLQSGCDSVLKRMARRCRTKDFADLTDKLRQINPQFNVTTDVIAGFPGETEEEWQQSLEFIASQPFGHIHAFTFSERDGTRAAQMPNQVPGIIRQRRSRELRELAISLKETRLNREKGQTLDVLWERGASLNDGQTSERRYQGYTPNYHRVFVDSHEDLTNRILPTQILGIRDGKLHGRTLRPDPR